MPDAPTTQTPPGPARTAGRRTVRFDTPEAVLADVDRLRRGGYRRVGQWSLPQACHHLAAVISGNLTPPPTDDAPTAEQLAIKEKFFGMVRGGHARGDAVRGDDPARRGGRHGQSTGWPPPSPPWPPTRTPGSWSAGAARSRRPRWPPCTWTTAPTTCRS